MRAPSSCGAAASASPGTSSVTGRSSRFLDLEHYLDVWSRKPGALAGSTPLAQRRQAGLWPASFDQIWMSLSERNGKQSGTKQMIDLLKLSRQYAPGKLQQAVELALSTGCHDAAAVKHLLNADELRQHWPGIATKAATPGQS